MRPRNAPSNLLGSWRGGRASAAHARRVSGAARVWLTAAGRDLPAGDPGGDYKRPAHAAACSRKTALSNTNIWPQQAGRRCVQCRREMGTRTFCKRNSTPVLADSLKLRPGGNDPTDVVLLNPSACRRRSWRERFDKLTAFEREHDRCAPSLGNSGTPATNPPNFQQNGPTSYVACT